MRILKPTGTPIELEDKTYNLLFTVDAIDDIQEHFDNDIVSILNSMGKDIRNGYKIVAYVLMTLINSAHERDGLKDRYDLKKISSYVTNSTVKMLIPLLIQVFNNDSPQREDDDPNPQSEQRKK